MAKEFKEKTITVNLRKVFEKPATKRAISAKNMLKKAVTKETKIENISVSNMVNETLWGRGLYNAPRKITVKIINEKGKAIVLMPSEKYEAKKEKTSKKEEKKTTSPAEAKAEAKPAVEKKETTNAPAKETPKETKTASTKSEKK